MDPKELSRIREKYLKTHGSVLSGNNYKYKMNDGKCFNCDKVGHRAIDSKLSPYNRILTEISDTMHLDTPLMTVEVSI